MYNIQIPYYNSNGATLNFSLNKGKRNCGSRLKKTEISIQFLNSLPGSRAFFLYALLLSRVKT